MKIITPKEKAKLYPKEDYDRNRAIYEAKEIHNRTYNDIALDISVNPQRLSIGRLQAIVLSFRKRHTREVKN